MRRLWAQHALWEPADSRLRPWRLVERDDRIRQRLLVIFLGERDPETAVACPVFAISQTLIGRNEGIISRNEGIIIGVGRRSSQRRSPHHTS